MIIVALRLFSDIDEDTKKKCDPHSNNELNENRLFSVNAMGHEIRCDTYSN